MDAPAKGDVAPLFSAEGTGGVTYSLSDYAGGPVVLVFYPGDATPVCTEQLNSYNHGLEQLADLNATVLALSPQDVESHETFSAKHGFQFPLLYDRNKQIGQMYGVVGPLGFYRRSVFIIDASGNLHYVNRAKAGLSYPSVNAITRSLKELAPTSR